MNASKPTAIIIMSSMSAAALAMAYESERMRVVRDLAAERGSDVFIVDGKGETAHVSEDSEPREITADSMTYDVVIMDEAHIVRGDQMQLIEDVKIDLPAIHAQIAGRYDRGLSVVPSLPAGWANRKERRASWSRSGEAKEGHTRLAFGDRNHRRSGKASLYRR